MQSETLSSADDSGMGFMESPVGDSLARPENDREMSEPVHLFIEANQLDTEQIDALMQIVRLALSNQDLSGTFGAATLERLLEDGRLMPYKDAVLALLEQDDRTSQEKLSERKLTKELGGLVAWFEEKYRNMEDQLGDVIAHQTTVQGKEQWRDFLQQEKARALTPGDHHSQADVPFVWSEEEHRVAEAIIARVDRQEKPMQTRRVFAKMVRDAVPMQSSEQSEETVIPHEQGIEQGNTLVRKESRRTLRMSLVTLLAGLSAVGIGGILAGHAKEVKSTAQSLYGTMKARLTTPMIGAIDSKALAESIDFLRTLGRENTTAGHAQNATIIAELKNQNDLSFQKLVEMGLLREDDFSIWKSAISEAKIRSQKEYKDAFATKFNRLLKAGSSADEIKDAMGNWGYEEPSNENPLRWATVLAHCVQSGGSAVADEVVPALDRQSALREEEAQSYWQAALFCVSRDPILASLFQKKVNSLLAGGVTVKDATSQAQIALMKSIMASCTQLAGKFLEEGKVDRAQELREFAAQLAENNPTIVENQPEQVTMNQ